MKTQVQRFGHSMVLGLSGVIFAALILSVSNANALDPNTKDPKAIVKAANDRDDGDKQIARSVWTLTDRSGRKRERVVQMWSLDFAEGDKILMIYESPADVRNTGFLSIDYSDEKKDDDQWLYLPSLRKTTRVASADKSDSLLGSDLSYFDMSTSINVDAYDYKIVQQSVKVDGDDCWLIETTPKTAKEKKESGYIKRHVWISKSKLMPIQVKAWLAKGKKLKYIKMSNIKKVDGIWAPFTISVRTVKKDKLESSTTLKFTSIKFNQASVKDDLFTQRRLEKGL